MLLFGDCPKCDLVTAAMLDTGATGVNLLENAV
jgi:hypothetical protein